MATTQTRQVSQLEISERSGAISLGAPQPSFVSNLKNRLKNPAIAHAAVVSSLPVDSQRTGDINVEDLLPDSIKSIHIHDLSADKLTAGTIDTSEITIISEDGSITITGAIMSIDDASAVRQVTFGNYNTTNYGIAFGPDPLNPDMEITGTILQVNSVGWFNLRSGSDITFHNALNTVVAQIGYTINSFIIQGDNAGGVNIYGPNVTLCETAGEFGGGVKVIFIANSTVVPSSNPITGGILYVDNGTLKFRGPSGSITSIAPA